MLNFRKPNPYSLVLSAVTCLSFSFSAAGQSKPAPPPAPQPESPGRQQQDSVARQQQAIATQMQSIERQRAAVQPQASARPSSLPFETAGQGQPFSPGCGPVPPMVLQSVVYSAAKAYDVEPNLIHAVIRQESGGYPCVVSEKGAMGLMQLMPDTAVEMGAVEPFDINQNVTAGTRLLAELLQRYKGDLNRVLGAYNAGPAAVNRAGGPPPFPETMNYVRSIMEQLKPPGDPKLFGAPVR